MPRRCSVPSIVFLTFSGELSIPPSVDMSPGTVLSRLRWNLLAITY